MSEHSDIELIEEMKKRFEEKNKALHDLRMMTKETGGCKQETTGV